MAGVGEHSFTTASPRSVPQLSPVRVRVDGGGDKAGHLRGGSSSSDEGYSSPVYRSEHEYSNLLTRAYSMATEKSSGPDSPQPNRVYKIVLTGGPCGGKTTGQDRLRTFFENMGWKVFTVPETATILLNGGVKFNELTEQQAFEFQKDLLLTLIRIEDVYFNQAKLIKNKNVLVICDRGAMDPSAYIDKESWQKMLRECGLEQFELRENRYNQIVHMVTAADGAPAYYTLANNTARKEDMSGAIEQDKVTRNAWVGHPYVDIIDNAETKKFDDKILKLIQVVCDRAGLPTQDRLSKNSVKRKWLIDSLDQDVFGTVKYEEFAVIHDYLLADNPDLQVRIRSRTQHNRTTYTITTRAFHPGDEGRKQTIETRMQINEKEYSRLMTMKDKSRASLHKKRRCFSYGNQYFNLDMYVDPQPPCLQGKQLMILETYTTSPAGTKLPALPPFLTVNKEITGDGAYSMYKLAQLSINQQ